ncbi:MAG: SCO family protein [Candidatus Hydrogenedentes bacterium]|nr:SCO family protein [Candidatus Hydrogenedentota bacterium]
MKRIFIERNRRSVNVAAVLVGACISLMATQAASAQTLGAPSPPDVGIDQKLGAQVPLELTFRDESGKTVKLADLMNGKPVVLSLVYYECPMLCGEVLQGMLSAFNKLPFTIGDQYQVFTVSFDPKETNELAVMKKKNMLEAYKDAKSGADGWHFLTGDQENIQKLADTVGFRFQYLPSADQYAHGSGIMLLTPDGKVSHYFYGIEYPESDLRLGLVDASEGKIGSLADAVLLLCYKYDPASGAYGLVIMRVLRLAAVATVLAISTLVGVLLMQEKRRRRRLAASDATAGSPALSR